MIVVVFVHSPIGFNLLYLTNFDTYTRGQLRFLEVSDKQELITLVHQYPFVFTQCPEYLIRNYLGEFS